MNYKNAANKQAVDVTTIFHNSIFTLSPGKDGEELKDQDRLLTRYYPDQSQQVAIICDGVSSSPNGGIAAEMVVNKVTTLYQEEGLKLIVKELLELREKLIDTPIFIDEPSSILKAIYEDIIREKYRCSYQTTLISIRISWSHPEKILTEIFSCGDSGLFIFTDQGELLYNNLNLLNQYDTFKHTSTRTDVLPDHFSTNNIISITREYPANTQFLLCSDGFYDGFNSFQEIFDWLNKNHNGLLQAEVKENLLADLHQRLCLKRGDDDISLIWLYPGASVELNQSDLNIQPELNNQITPTTKDSIKLFNRDSLVSIAPFPILRLFTIIIAVLATLSGINLAFIILSSELLAVCCGLFCGLITYCINRFVLTNILLQRRKIIKNNHRLSRFDTIIKVIASISPSIIIAILLAILISIPISLKIFQTEIRAEITRDNHALTVSAESHMKQRLSEISTLEENNESYRREIEKGEKRLTQLRQQLLVEARADGSRELPDETNFQKLKAEADTFEKEMKQNATRILLRIQANTQHIHSLRLQLSDYEMIRYSIEAKSGLLGQLSALSELTQKQSIIYWCNNSIILLILLIEITPIIILAIYDSVEISNLRE